MTLYLGDAKDESLEKLVGMFAISPEARKGIDEILVVWRESELYEDAIRVFFRGVDSLHYIVTATHCSCYEYEGAWKPELLSADYERIIFTSEFDRAVKQYLESLRS